MDPYVVKVRIERETRRVAAAFRVTEWDETYSGSVSREYAGDIGEIDIKWSFEVEDGRLGFVQVQQENSYIIHLIEDTRPWPSFNSPQLDEIMARGLYRLGIEFSQLPAFTAHEKLELRLSLPREFWPKKWLEEEER